MTTRGQTLLGGALVLVGVGIHVARLAVPPSELARKGAQSVGQVLFKDSRPDSEGRFVYTVTFVFPDASQRNYQVERVVPDKGVWDRLKTGAEVKVRYMPGRPEEASIEGAEGLARPRDAAYAYLAWSAILAGVVVLAMALRRGSTGPSDVTKHPPRVVRGGR